MASENPLISTHKADAGALQINLHPLVILTISDYITRHTLRQQKGPIVGGILGQQNGREITLEHAFESQLIADPNAAGGLLLDNEKFGERLQQYKDVHKPPAPALDLVGWFTVAPLSGPQEHQLILHRRISESYNESAVLLAFHPTELSISGGKLPITIYESVIEGAEDAGRQMEVEGEEAQLKMRFRELPYSIETGEAEMISVDFVARGGGNASAVSGPTDSVPALTGNEMEVETADDKNIKGKGKAVAKQEEPTVKTNGVVLSSEDDELIASLTSKANAIKMLHSRIQLIIKYLENLPPSHLNISRDSNPTTPPPSTEPTETNHTILRAIQALVNRLPLLIPADQTTFESEMLTEKTDVQLVALLGSLSRSVNDVRTLGRKYAQGDSQQAKKKGAFSDDPFTSFNDIFDNPSEGPLATKRHQNFMT